MPGLFQELKRRNVIRVAVAYLIAAWLLLQVTEVLTGLMELPTSLGKTVIAVLAIGFPLVVAFAWAFELTPEGIKRDSEVDRSRSVAGQTGKRLNVLIILMLALAAGYFFWEARLKSPAPPVPAIADGPGVDAPAAPTDEPVSIAVLPFVNMSADPDNEYFADGLSEEILNRLAQVPKLRVIGRTSAFAFKGDNRDLREIGALLGSGNILEGSVRRQGEQVRITAQLIETTDGAHLWSQTWDRRLDDVFAIQDEIAANVVNALDIVLDETTRQAMLTAGVRDVDAFVAYQKGYRAYIDAHGQADMLAKLEAANELFDTAIAVAPDFADAYARKTDYYAHIVLDSEVDVAERQSALDTLLDLYTKARDLARDPQRRRVIELDRTFFTDDWTRLPGLISEIVNDDGCADGNWVELTLPFTPADDMIRYYERQIRCDPLMLVNYAFLAILQAGSGDPDAAQQTLDRGQATGGSHHWLRSQARQLRLQTGAGDSVVEELTRQAGSLPEGSPERARALSQLAYAQAALGRLDEARTLIRELQQSASESGIDVLILHTVVGDRAAANAAAAALDKLPGGPTELIRRINGCDCGAPFDLEATPRLAARIREAGFPWPPPQRIDFPAKDW